MAEKLVVYIPFEQEMRLAEQWPDTAISSSTTEDYLQGLMDRLITHMELPAGMTITVHYSDDEVLNAFATLGGHVIVHRGLLEQMPSENALAMVLAHEAAHIKLRHPIISMGRGVVIGMALTSLSGFGGDQLLSQFLGTASMMTLMTFSREQEREADRLGLAAIAAEYGHVADATTVYQRFLEKSDRLEKFSPEFISTHPLSSKRIQQVKTQARNEHWPDSGALTPLPDFLTSKQH
jgi:predicted Zn-dependent protease